VTYRARQRPGVAESLLQIGGPLWIVGATAEVRVHSHLLDRWPGKGSDGPVLIG